MVGGQINFGTIHHDTICSPFSFHVFYLEIYLRLCLNFVTKNILNIVSTAVNSDSNDYITNYRRQVLRLVIILKLLLGL